MFVVVVILRDTTSSNTGKYSSSNPCFNRVCLFFAPSLTKSPVFVCYFFPPRDLMLPWPTSRQRKWRDPSTWPQLAHGADVLTDLSFRKISFFSLTCWLSAAGEVMGNFPLRWTFPVAPWNRPAHPWPDGCRNQGSERAHYAFLASPLFTMIVYLFP